MKYDYSMVVGRFQPVQNGHLNLLNHALEKGKKVIVILGSAHSIPTIKNPFTVNQRKEMILSSFPEEVRDRFIFKGVRDYPYNENLWIAEIQNIANELLEEGETMTLVGHFKDESSYYLNLFPQWELEQYRPTPEKSLNATEIREVILTSQTENGFDLNHFNKIKSLVHSNVFDFLLNFSKTELCKDLANEYKYVQKYKADSRFVGMSFAPTFVTTDTIVTALGHILVVRRGHQPGKGSLALPGGFLAGNITLKENALKELSEETKIRIPKQVLEASVTASKVFDYPHRSLRGRTITHAFLVELHPSLVEGLPRVKGGDDADKAFWLPMADFLRREEEFFEDHNSIVREMLGI